MSKVNALSMGTRTHHYAAAHREQHFRRRPFGKVEGGKEIRHKVVKNGPVFGLDGSSAALASFARPFVEV